MQGAAAALVTGVEGRQQVDHLGAAHLADDQPVGAHPQRLAHQGRAPSTSPAPSRLGGRASSQTQCGWSGRSSWESSTSTSRSPGSDQRQQRAEQRGLARAGAAADEERRRAGDDRRAAAARRRGVSAPAATSSSRRERRGARGTRSEISVPGRAIGASRAWQRVPSASRTSTNGLASSSRRPPRAASRWARRRTAASSANRTSARPQPLAACRRRRRSVPLTTHVGHARQRAAAARAGRRRARRGAAPRAPPSTVASPTGRPDARSASATRWAVSAPGRSASRSRTSSTTTTSSTAASIARRRAPGHAARRSGARSASTPERGAAERARVGIAPGRGRGRSPPRARAGRASARPPGRVSRATASASTRSPRSTSRSGRGSRNRAHSRTAEARPATVGTRQHEHPVAPRDQLLDQRVDGPRQVDHHRVVPALGGGHGVAHRERLQAALGTGVPGQHAEPVAPRQGLAQRAAAEPPGRLAQRVPPDAVVVVEPEHPVGARPERVGVDDHGRAGAGGHLAEGARERRGPGAARAADHADGHRAVRARRRRRRPAARSTQPDERGSSATFSAPSASAVRNTSSGTPPRRDDVHAAPGAAARAGLSALARSTPTSTSGAWPQALRARGLVAGERRASLRPRRPAAAARRAGSGRRSRRVERP